MDAGALEALAERLKASPALAAKADIGIVAARLGLAQGAIPVGDDCAAIPDGDGHLLFAAEGFISAFVDADPWFAGWCGVMVNLSDVAAMGGRPLGIVDVVWAEGKRGRRPFSTACAPRPRPTAFRSSAVTPTCTIARHIWRSPF
jgi:uncharacterized protein